MTLTLDSILTGRSLNPPRIIVYGGPGLGKSTFAANAPKPIFINMENGLGNLDVASFPLAKTYEDVDAQLRLLFTENHNYQTVVIDSLDWFERLLWDKIARDNGVMEIENLNWGKGFVYAINLWQNFVKNVNRLSMERNISVIFTAHSEVTTLPDPERGEYSQYNIALHKKAHPILVKDVDAILFVRKDGIITTDKNSFGKETKRALGDGVRTVITQMRPSAIAKNRYGLSPVIEIKEGDIMWSSVWNELAAKVPYYQALTKGEIKAPSPADKLPTDA